MARAYGWMADGVTVDPVEADEARRWAAYLLDDTDPPPTLRGLVRDLDQRGILTVTGKTWSPIVIRRALTAPRMVGKKLGRDGALVDADMDPILDVPTWERLRTVLLDPARQKFAPVRTRISLLTGDHLVWCGACGRDLSYNAASGVMACTLRGGGCGQVSISAPLLEADVTERVLARLTEPGWRCALWQAMVKAGGPAALGEQLEGYREKLAQLGADFAEGLIERDSLLAGTERLRALIAAAESAVQRAVALEDAPAPAVEDVLAWWEAAPVERQHGIVVALLDHVVVRTSEGRSVIGADRLDYHWRDL